MWTAIIIFIIVVVVYFFGVQFFQERNDLGRQVVASGGIKKKYATLIEQIRYYMPYLREHSSDSSGITYAGRNGADFVCVSIVQLFGGKVGIRIDLKSDDGEKFHREWEFSDTESQNAMFVKIVQSLSD